MWLAKSLDRAEAAGTPDLAKKHAAALLADDPWEWRALWMDGLAAVKLEDWEGAKASFNAVYQQVPGRAGPEAGARVRVRARRRCRMSPRGCTPPARPPTRRTSRPRRSGWPGSGPCGGTRRARWPRSTWCPTTSRGYPESRQLRAEVLLAGSGSDLGVLDQAMQSIESVQMDGITRQQYTVRILQHALQGGAGPARARSTSRSGRTTPPRRASATGLEHAFRRWLAMRPTSGEGRAGRPGQRRPHVDADMSTTVPALRRRGRRRREVLRELRQADR